MKPASKNLTLFLALLLTAQMTACGTSETAQDTAETAETTAVTETAAETVDDGKVYDDLGDITFDGQDFHMWLAYEELTGYNMEEQTGEVFDDAVFDRNLAVEERLDVKLIFTASEHDFGGGGYAKGCEDIKNYVLSNDTTYDVYQQVQHRGIPGLIAEGYFVDWKTVPNVNLTKPYWHLNAIEEINFGSRIYMLTGFYENSIMSSQSCVYFNKNILTNAQVAFPYDAVLDGTWTYDKFMEIIHGTAQDLNGDGKMELKNDLYGYVGRLWNSPYAMFISMGGDMLAKGEGNVPVDVINTERNIDIVDRILALENPAEGTCIISDTQEMIRMFHDSETATIHGELRYSYENFRDMDDDFGFVPPPKFDEKQEGYHSWIRHSAPLSYIPITNTDLAFTGAVLEILAMESFNRVTPAYFDTVLTAKIARDTQSEAMIPVILECASFYDHVLTTPDIVTCFDQKKGLATEYAKYQTSVATLLEELTEIYS